MTRDEIIDVLNDTIDDAVDRINQSTPATQRRVLEEVSQIVRDLDYDGNNIARTVKNMRAIGNITRKLRSIIMDANYKEEVKDFIKSFSEVTTLQNQYLRQTTKEFKFDPVLKEIKAQSIEATIESLTEQGLTANITDKIKDVLRRNITTGGSFTKIMQQVRETIVSTKAGEGILERYVKQITTDSLNQYSRNYLQIATEGLEMPWRQYTGSNIKTTRCFCHAMTERKYFHIAEIPKLLEGDFEEFKKRDCEIYSRTGLPQGMVPGTNVSNFETYAGGFNCNHRAIVIPDRLVPENVREKFYNEYPRYRPKTPAQPDR